MSSGVLTATAAPDQPELEALLLQRVADGDQAALGELYDRLSRPLFSLALHILRDRTEAEDVVHDVFLTLADKAATYDRSRGSALAWAITFVRHRAIDRLRKRRRRGDLLAQSAPEDLGYSDTPPAAAEPLAHAELSVAVKRAVDTLPEDQRRVLELAFYRGMSQTEIAEQLAAPLGTVKARIRRGLLRLRTLLPRRP